MNETHSTGKSVRDNNGISTVANICEFFLYILPFNLHGSSLTMGF